MYGGPYFSCKVVNTGMHHNAQGDLGTLVGQPHSMAKTKQENKMGSLTYIVTGHCPRKSKRNRICTKLDCTS